MAIRNLASGKCHQNILLYNDIIILITVEICFEKKYKNNLKKVFTEH